MGSNKVVTSVTRRLRKPRIVVGKRRIRTVICAGKSAHSVAERMSDCCQPWVHTKRLSCLPKRRALRKSTLRR